MRSTQPKLLAADGNSRPRKNTSMHNTQGKSAQAALSKAVLAEALGTMLLLAIVIGSGIMGERLSGGNAAVALLANTAATVGGLYVLIEVLGPVSGAHFNPAVSLIMMLRGALPGPHALAYVLVQLAAAVLGAMLAHVMFDLPLHQVSTKLRMGQGQCLAEAVATAGLLFVILRAPSGKVSAMVAAYIGAAYWFTASTSFANPAATLGRMVSDTFAGIAPSCVPAFIASQLAGGLIGWGLAASLSPSTATS